MTKDFAEEHPPAIPLGQGCHPTWPGLPPHPNCLACIPSAQDVVSVDKSVAFYKLRLYSRLACNQPAALPRNDAPIP